MVSHNSQKHSCTSSKWRYDDQQYSLKFLTNTLKKMFNMTKDISKIKKDTLASSLEENTIVNIIHTCDPQESKFVFNIDKCNYKEIFILYEADWIITLLLGLLGNETKDHVHAASLAPRNSLPNPGSVPPNSSGVTSCMLPRLPSSATQSSSAAQQNVSVYSSHTITTECDDNETEDIDLTQTSNEENMSNVTQSKTAQQPQRNFGIDGNGMIGSTVWKAMENTYPQEESMFIDSDLLDVLSHFRQLSSAADDPVTASKYLVSSDGPDVGHTDGDFDIPGDLGLTPSNITEIDDEFLRDCLRKTKSNMKGSKIVEEKPQRNIGADMKEMKVPMLCFSDAQVPNQENQKEVAQVTSGVYLLLFFIYDVFYRLSYSDTYKPTNSQKNVNRSKQAGGDRDIDSRQSSSIEFFTEADSSSSDKFFLKIPDSILDNLKIIINKQKRANISEELQTNEGADENRINDTPVCKAITSSYPQKENLCSLAKVTERRSPDLSDALPSISCMVSSLDNYQSAVIIKPHAASNKSHAEHTECDTVDAEALDLVQSKSRKCDNAPDGLCNENLSTFKKECLRKVMNEVLRTGTAEGGENYFRLLMSEVSFMREKQFSLETTVLMLDKRATMLENVEARKLEVQNFLLSMKFNPERHMPWRHELLAYNVESGGARNNQYQFMHFEAFRLCSFNYLKFPPKDDVRVTHLAKNGFFYKNHETICFGCEGKAAGSMDSALEDPHTPRCARHESNKPLDKWIQDLNQEQLVEYYTYYGSLTPYLIESLYLSGIPLENVDTTLQTRSTLSFAQLEHQNSGSSGYESELPRSGISERENNVPSESIRPNSHSETLPIAVEGEGHKNPFEKQSHSSPSSLSGLPDVIASEERHPDASYQFVTSSARYFRHFFRPVENNMSQLAEGGSMAEGGLAVAVDHTLDLNNISYPQFSSESVRRKTYTTWRPEHTHRPDDLASAGFFYAGYGDCVRCFCCGLGLKFWRPFDIPAYQHAKYRPLCVFNRLYKGQEYIDRVQQDVLAEQVAANTVPDRNQNMPTQTEQTVRETVTERTASHGQQDHMSSAAAQEALSNGWSRDQVQQAVNHIVNIFGESCLELDLLTDTLRGFNNVNDSGFYSDVSQPTISASAHAPHPPALNVADNTQERETPEHTPEGEGMQASASSIQQPSTPNLSLLELFRSVEREHTLLAERIICRVCRSKQISCIFMPCGHVVACQECADQATHCISCRKQIVGTANVYLA